jgi:ABC-2 type transport system permease protein
LNVLHIAAREFKSMFTSAIGWVFLAAFLFLSGMFWLLQLDDYVSQAANLVYNPYGAATMTVSDGLLAPFYGNSFLIYLMVVPAISMRLFSEEINNRTLELLQTSPVSSLEIVLGKYLGALGFVAVMLTVMLYAPLSLTVWTTPEWGVVFGGYVAVFALSASLLALGMLCSSFTSNQMVAYILAFCASLALYIISWRSHSPDDWANQLSVLSHMQDLVKGAFRASDLTYYGALVGFFLFCTHQRVESLRWR